jgi:large subunit ribosomal protein L17
MRNLSRALILTCDQEAGTAKANGRIRTTLEKAKEVRPFVEKLVTIAVKAKKCLDDANALKGPHAHGTDEYKKWRATEAGQAWLKAQAKYIHRRRQLFDLLRSKKAVSLLIDQIASQFEGRPGGYTRVVKLAKRRLADAAKLAYIEFVGEPTKLSVVSKS